MEAVTGAASIKEESFNMWDLKHLEDSNTHLSRAEFFKNPSRFNNVAKVKTGYKNFIFCYPSRGDICGSNRQLANG